VAAGVLVVAQQVALVVPGLSSSVMQEQHAVRGGPSLPLADTPTTRLLLLGHLYHEQLCPN